MQALSTGGEKTCVPSSRGTSEVTPFGPPAGSGPAACGCHCTCGRGALCSEALFPGPLVDPQSLHPGDSGDGGEGGGCEERCWLEPGLARMGED